MKRVLSVIVLLISITIYSFGQVTSALLNGDVVINKIYNSGEASGANDAIELLVIKHASDLRGLQIVDFKSGGKNGREAVRKLSQNSVFASLRAGTFIVIRNSAVSADYTLKDAGDFNLDIGMQDANFVTYVTGPTFDVFNDDMVILSRDGDVGSPIAVLGNGPGTSLSFAACNTTFFRLNDPVITAAGTFVYVTSPTSSLNDYKHAGTTAGGYVYNAAKTKSNVTLNNDATPSPLKLGKHNNITNATYINQLRMISPSYFKICGLYKSLFC